MILSEEKLRQIQSIMERDPQAYSEIEFGLLRHAQGQRRQQRATARLVTNHKKELEQLRVRNNELEQRAEKLARGLHSVAEAVSRSRVDWESERDLAWIFAILRGWEELEDEVAEKFQWTSRQRALQEEYRQAVRSICQSD